MPAMRAGEAYPHRDANRGLLQSLQSFQRRAFSASDHVTVSFFGKTSRSGSYMLAPGFGDRQLTSVFHPSPEMRV